MFEGLIHVRTPDESARSRRDAGGQQIRNAGTADWSPLSNEPRWKLVPLVLALAFAVRAAVALTGDFVLHPDEIMQ